MEPIELTDEERATRAAELLSEVNPTRDILNLFFDELEKWDEVVYAELLTRAEERIEWEEDEEGGEA